MSERPWIIQVLFVAAACVLFVAAGLLQEPIAYRAEIYGINPPQVEENHPDRALLLAMPGALRAFGVNYLWIRAQALKDEGKYYDAMELANLICALQPNFDGVWAFHAWNMAWNISVATHTREERWKWVYEGVVLLRDKGIPRNPDSLILYKELAWIFFSKMGGFMDEMQKSYKDRWAGMMQRLLGAPDMTHDWAETLDAFRPIVEAPLDRDHRRQGRELIQADQRERLLSDPDVAAYAALLASHTLELDKALWTFLVEYDYPEPQPDDKEKTRITIRLDETFLAAYDRFSEDYSVQVYRRARSWSERLARVVRPAGQPPGPHEAVAKLINDPVHAAARAKILAFVRAQILWNRYRMDPEWMLAIMERFKAPIDWRHTWPHGLYWSTYGMHKAEGKGLAKIDYLNTGRITLNCLKYLTWYGRMTVTENPTAPLYPVTVWHPDHRLIEPTHQEHIAAALADMERRVQEGKKPREFKDNSLRAGHENYLKGAIKLLVARQQLGRAQGYLEYLKDTYKFTGGEWDLALAKDFAMALLRKDGKSMTRESVESQITASVLTAMVRLARRDEAGFRASMGWALKVYGEYRKTKVKIQRMQMPEMADYMAPLLADLLIDPPSRGYRLSLEARAGLYRALALKGYRPVLIRAYRWMAASALAAQCRVEGLSFQKAFPKPQGYDEFQRRMQEQLPRRARPGS